MSRPALLALLLVPALASAKPWKPHPVKVLPGVPMRAEDIKPYTPPNLPPDPIPEPSEVKVIEVTADPEAMVEIRPMSSPMVGSVAKGARLPVRGTVPAKGRGCSGKVWYAVEPFGWVCSRDVKVTAEPPTSESVLKVREGERLPFHYVMVLVKEGDKVPMWASFDALKRGEEPERQLERGDTIAIERPLSFDNEKYWVSVEGKVMPQKGSGQMGPGSAWQGLPLDESMTLPFGWITPEKANAYDAIPENAKTPATAQLERRARVQILEEQLVGKKKFLKVKQIAPPPTTSPSPSPAPSEAAPATPAELWVSADAVNEVRQLARPATVPADVERWIDVDLGEQVLVLYEKDKPVFATLVSSGRAIPTPMGTYPVWAKVAAITMKNQPYEDKGYFVNKVPWSTFLSSTVGSEAWNSRDLKSRPH